jgi:hypothetical protein
MLEFKMNERILELAVQAGVTGYFAAGTEYATPIPLTPELQKFAELIVLECASLFEDDLRPMGDFTERACRRAIKEHFGVE